MLMLVIRMAMPARYMIHFSGEESWINAPIIMMLLMALVTLINGVCRAGVTFQITM